MVTNGKVNELKIELEMEIGLESFGFPRSSVKVLKQEHT